MSKYVAVIALALCSVLAVRADVSPDFLAKLGLAPENLPKDFLTEVNGYQDDFSNGLDPGVWKWTSSNGRTNPFSLVTLAGGRTVLQHTGNSASTNNHLLCEPGEGYSSTTGTQEVLMHVQMTYFQAGTSGTANSYLYGGPAVSVDPDASTGIDLHFVQFTGQLGSQRYKLGLGAANANRFYPGEQSAGTVWVTNEWYWIRLVHDMDSGMVYAKAWLSGTEEPDSWGATVQNVSGYAGLAGIASSNRNATFNVDYFLVKADGLPAITVGRPIPEPATMSLLALGGLALLRRRRQ